MTRRGCLLLLVLGAACATPTAVVDLDGSPATPLAVAAGMVHVVVFTSQECPIANAYAPTLRDLAARWQDAPVRLFLVHVDPDLSAEAARAHAAAYELPGRILLDPCHQLATALGVTKTPEAAVVSSHGLVYRGRIDDQWQALGARSIRAGSHDLADAVAATLAGQPVATPFPPPVGCLLPEPHRR